MSVALHDPFTEDFIQVAPAASAEEVDAACEAAQRSFKSGVWSEATGAQRAHVLRAIARGIDERRDTLALMDTMGGKLLADAEADIAECVTCFEYYADEAERFDSWREAPVASESSGDDFSFVLRYEPCGVAALISPWNYPALMACWKLAPALASGSSVVLKPSEFAPCSTLEMGEVCKEAGLPDGVLNVVSGLGREVGAALAEHPAVNVFSFTGSVPTGQAVMNAAARGARPVTLELGGKSAAIVLESNDEAFLEQCVEWVMAGIFLNAGQVCSACSRLLVHASVYDRFVARLVAEARCIRMGDPHAPTTQMGPLVSKSQFERVMGFIERARDAGISLACGGGRAPLERGHFVEPTIFTNVPVDAEVWTEEVFGPVLAVRAFESEAEAIALANDSRFGLAAAVFGQETTQVQRVARQLECGTVWLNCSQPAPVEVPWGGVKESGLGRGLGRIGLLNFLEQKVLCERTGEGWAQGLYFQRTRKL